MALLSSLAVICVTSQSDSSIIFRQKAAQIGVAYTCTFLYVTIIVMLRVVGGLQQLCAINPAHDSKSPQSKSHGSGCTTALSRIHRYLYRVYCLTPPTSLCSDNTQNLHSSTVERIPKQCLHPRPKVNVLATHPTF